MLQQEVQFLIALQEQYLDIQIKQVRVEMKLILLVEVFQGLKKRQQAKKIVVRGLLGLLVLGMQ